MIDLAKRDRLIAAVNMVLIPAIAQAGFQLRNYPLVDSADSGNLKFVFPAGTFERTRNGLIDIVEIQFDKHGGASFVINFAISQTEEVILPWGTFRREELGASAFKGACRVYSSRFLPRWFSLGWFSNDLSKESHRCAERATALFVGASAWFESGRVTPFVRPFGTMGG